MKRRECLLCTESVPCKKVYALWRWRVAGCHGDLLDVDRLQSQPFVEYRLHVIISLSLCPSGRILRLLNTLIYSLAATNSSSFCVS